MRSKKDKTSLSNAKRIYTCPLVFIAPEDSQTRLKKKPSRVPKGQSAIKVQPKKDNELSLKQHERLQQLLSIYAEQSSQSFRIPATNIGSLPKLAANNYDRKRAVVQNFGCSFSKYHNGIDHYM